MGFAFCERVAYDVESSFRRQIMILAVGATGLLGTRICERLRVEGQAVRALVRRTSGSRLC